MNRKIILLFIVLCISTAYPAGASVKLNRGIKAQFSAEPNYAKTRDSNDAYQLSDNVIKKCSLRAKSTVAWMSVKRPLEIVFDLKSTCQVQEIRVHSTGGKTNVPYPKFIWALGSRDGVHYSYLAKANRKGLTHGQRQSIPHRFDLTGPYEDQARFVKIIVLQDVGFFADEIEILGTKKTEFKSSSGPVFKSTLDFLMWFTKNKLIDDKFRANKNHYPKDSDYSSLEAFSTEFDAGRLRAGKDLVSLEGKLISLNRKAAGTSGYLWRLADPFDQLYRDSDVGTFLDAAKNKTIDLVCSQNESEYFAVDLLNLKDKGVDCRVSVSPLSGATNKSYSFELFRTEYVATNSLRYLADPLIQIDDHFSLAQNDVQQLFVKFESNDLAPGQYTGAIVLILDNAQQLIPIEITILDWKIPAKASIYNYHWAYPSWGDRKRELWPQVAKDLAQMRTNVAFFTTTDLYADTPNGVSLNKPRLASAIAEAFDAEYYWLFLGFGSYSGEGYSYEKFGPWMSDQWKQNFAQWLAATVDYFESKGIAADRLLFNPLDENVGKDFYKAAKLIKTLQPEVKVVANWINDDTGAVKRLLPYVDIWCLCFDYPNRKKSLEMIRNSGAQVWAYTPKFLRRLDGGDDQSTKDASPSGYYRAMPWLAFNEDFGGIGFWAYSSSGWNGPYYWDDYFRTRGDYGIVYLGIDENHSTDQTLVTSRRKEAWTKGLQDYEYLRPQMKRTTMNFGRLQKRSWTEPSPSTQQECS
jgi:hypothetical protein